MADSKHTKRALLGSALALILCFAMLLGSTFAWFTDTAKTNVNKIQAGTLKISLVDDDKNPLTGPIKWIAKDKDGNVQDQDSILWEPGATYRTEWFKLINEGNLALKYKVYINGFTGDTQLLDKLTFSVLLSGDTVPGGMKTTTLVKAADGYSFDGYLLPASESIVTGESATTPEEVKIRITAKMDEKADNDYQGLSLNGVTITVVATQYTYEIDSTNKNTYDADATYPDLPSTQP